MKAQMTAWNCFLAACFSAMSDANCESRQQSNSSAPRPVSIIQFDDRHIQRLAARRDPRALTPNMLPFSSEDMKEVFNSWRAQPQEWMNAKNLEKRRGLKTKQEKHLFSKGRFNTMLFDIFGNKALVDTLIRIPICSAQRPATVLKAFAKACDHFRHSQKRKKSA